MKSSMRLPDAEFEIMKIIWANNPPINTNIIMGQLGKEKGWKPQTVITLLSRLAKRGFIQKERNGKECTYFPIVSQEDYLKFETSDFMERFYENSFTSLIETLYDSNKLKDRDLDELAKWLREKRD